MPIDIVFAGNLLVDDVVFSDGRTRMGQAGGAMLYAALGAVLWGARAGIVSVVGDDYPARALDALEERGVSLEGVRRLGRPGVRTWLLYEEKGRRVVHHLGRPSHAEVSPGPADVPQAFEEARAFHVSPIPIECQRALVEHAAGWPGAFVSLDPHEPIQEDNLPAWLDLLKEVDGLFTGQDELKLRSLDSRPRVALERLSVGRMQLVVFKRGERGGLLYQRPGKRFLEWLAAGPKAIDCTGAGDAFAGGFLAGLLSTGSLQRAIEQGVVSASFAIEAWGATGLLVASRAQAEQRLDDWFEARAGA